MNTHWMALAVAPALMAPLLICGDQRQEDGLVRVNAPSAAQAQNSGPQQSDDQKFEAASWKDRLSARDLDVREREFDALVAELRSNPNARSTVEAWSKDDTNSELAWTSRLALRQSGEVRGGFRGQMRALPWGDLRSRFDDLERRFDGMDSLFEDVQREMERALQGGASSTPAPGGAARKSAQSYSMQVGPDGVKVEVFEDVDGKSESKTYTAKTMDELYAAHPELRDRLGARVDIQSGPLRQLRIPGGMNGLFGGGANRSPFGMDDDDQDQALRPALPLQGGALRTDILGVHIQEPSADQRRDLKLDEGVGLVVESVEPGTIAHKIGVARGDCLVELNGRALKSTADVRDALSKRPANEDVSVTLVDQNGKRRTLTWRAPAASEESRKF